MIRTVLVVLGIIALGVAAARPEARRGIHAGWLGLMLLALADLAL